MSDYEQVEQGEHLGEATSEPRWRSITLMILPFFYMGVIALIGGRFLAYMMPGEGDSDVVAELSHEASKFELIGVNKARDLEASLSELYSFHEHGEALCATYMEHMGLDPKRHVLLQLHVSNLRDEQALPLSDHAGLIELRTTSGELIRNKALPPNAHDELTELRLIQHRASGELKPDMQARYWVLFEGQVELKDVRSGELTFDDGEKLELKLFASDE